MEGNHRSGDMGIIHDVSCQRMFVMMLSHMFFSPQSRDVVCVVCSFLVKMKNAFVPVKRVYSVNTYS